MCRSNSARPCGVGREGAWDGAGAPADGVGVWRKNTHHGFVHGFLPASTSA